MDALSYIVTIVSSAPFKPNWRYRSIEFFVDDGCTFWDVDLDLTTPEIALQSPRGWRRLGRLVRS